MPRRRSICGVLDNFLSSYTSRYSAYDGYWLFGFLVDELDGWQLEILEKHDQTDGSIPLRVATHLAVEKFLEQLNHARLPLAWVPYVKLSTTVRPDLITQTAGNYTRQGHLVDFTAGATLDTYRVYQRKRTIFVARHDPSQEGRSGV